VPPNLQDNDQKSSRLMLRLRGMVAMSRANWPWTYTTANLPSMNRPSGVITARLMKSGAYKKS
jgi:hypothetical protein